MKITTQEEMTEALERIGGAGHGAIKATSAALGYSTVSISKALKGDYSEKFARAVETVIAKIEESNIKQIEMPNRHWILGVPELRSRDETIENEVVVVRITEPSLAVRLARYIVPADFGAHIVPAEFGDQRFFYAEPEVTWLSQEPGSVMRDRLIDAAVTRARAHLSETHNAKWERDAVEARRKRAIEQSGALEEDLAVMSQAGIVADGNAHVLLNPNDKKSGINLLTRQGIKSARTEILAAIVGNKQRTENESADDAFNRGYKQAQLHNAIKYLDLLDGHIEHDVVRLNAINNVNDALHIARKMKEDRA